MVASLQASIHPISELFQKFPSAETKRRVQSLIRPSPVPPLPAPLRPALTHITGSENERSFAAPLTTRRSLSDLGELFPIHTALVLSRIRVRYLTHRIDGCPKKTANHCVGERCRLRGVWFWVSLGVGQACAVTAFCPGADRTRTSPTAAGTDRIGSASFTFARSFDGSVAIALQFVLEVVPETQQRFLPCLLLFGLLKALNPSTSIIHHPSIAKFVNSNIVVMVA